jgi:hypothetical protein
MIIGTKNNRRKISIASVATLVKLAKLGEDGKGWYKHAKLEIEGAAFILDCDPKRFADILSLLSPRVSVTRNIRFAVKYLETGEHAHDVMRLIRSSVAHYEKTGEIRGPKTGPFASALLGNTEAIVLDTWMAVAFGFDQDEFRRKPVASECCKRIRKAAKILGWAPCEVQAAVWVATVRKAGRHATAFNVIKEIAA